MLFLKLVALTLTFSLFSPKAGFSQVYLPGLDQALINISKHYEELVPNQIREIHFKVKELYFRIFSNKNQLSVAEGVEKHFEKAISKAEEKFNEGDDSVSQSDITKLKLGLSKTLNGIIELKSEIDQSFVSLGLLMGYEIYSDTKIEGKGFETVDFPFQNWNNFKYEILNRDKSITSKNQTRPLDFLKNRNKLGEFKIAFIKIQEARSKMQLMARMKKNTRALLIPEVANHDFGVGDSEDLFEALVIYTEVQRGHFQAIYNFNIAVAALERLGSFKLKDH